MCDAWESGNFAELAELAHWLKGAAGTVGFHDFTEPAKRLESLAKRAVTEVGVTEDIEPFIASSSIWPQR